MFASRISRVRLELLAKPFDQITATDIAYRCDNGGAYESLGLEFKRELPGRDSRPDPSVCQCAGLNLDTRDRRDRRQPAARRDRYAAAQGQRSLRLVLKRQREHVSSRRSGAAG